MARIPALKQLVFVCAHTFTTIHRQPSRQRAVSRNLRIILLTFFIGFIIILHWEIQFRNFLAFLLFDHQLVCFVTWQCQANTVEVDWTSSGFSTSHITITSGAEVDIVNYDYDFDLMLTGSPAPNNFYSDIPPTDGYNVYYLPYVYSGSGTFILSDEFSQTVTVTVNPANAAFRDHHRAHQQCGAHRAGDFRRHRRARRRGRPVCRGAILCGHQSGGGGLRFAVFPAQSPISGWEITT